MILKISSSPGFLLDKNVTPMCFEITNMLREVNVSWEVFVLASQPPLDAASASGGVRRNNDKSGEEGKLVVLMRDYIVHMTFFDISVPLLYRAAKDQPTSTQLEVSQYTVFDWTNIKHFLFEMLPIYGLEEAISKSPYKPSKIIQAN